MISEQNLIEHIGKCEAEVTKKDCARRIVLLELTTDKHEASCGLSVTAELLVSVIICHRYFAYPAVCLICLLIFIAPVVTV